jgi:RNA polymerase sigma-B factor
MTDQGLRRRGDSRARAELAARYLPLARGLALRYRHGPEPIEELVQVASLGLVKAIDRWDPERGTTFATFAVPTILGELRRHFRDCSWMVRPPRAIQELSLHVIRARDRHWGMHGREPTVDELAAALGRCREEVVDALAAADGQRPVSLDAPVGDGDEPGTYHDLMGAADRALVAADERVFVDDLLNRLDRRARDVLRLRFEFDLRQREIAERIGVSQMHVSRILRDALATLHRNGTGIPPGAPHAAQA